MVGSPGTTGQPRGRVAGLLPIGFVAVGLVLAGSCIALTVLARDAQADRAVLYLLLALVCAGLGVTVIRSQPRNPVGWLLLGEALLIIVVLGTAQYALLDYHLRGGRLPFGAVDVVVHDEAGPVLVLELPLIILLFPDGRLGRRGRWLLWLYLAAVAVQMVGSTIEEVAGVVGHTVQVNSSGDYSGNAGPHGWAAAVANVAGSAWLLLPPMWVTFVARQVRAWRRASAERRQQLKWLMTGAAVTLVGASLVSLAPPASTATGHGLRDLAAMLMMALPVAIAVAILRYRLYDIDRLVSRTISYASVTAVLIGVYVGGVALATRVLPFSSPVGVAASTLMVAALFNPLRRRAQRLIDRRFNRSGYDAEATIAAFTAALRNEIDLDRVQGDLVDAVTRSVQPAHVAIWIRSSA